MLAGIAINGTKTQRFDFRLSSGAFREDEIFDAATCTPSRYIIEIGRRILKAMPTADLLAIGNPLLPLSSGQIAEWLQGVRDVPAIVTDEAKFPLLYVLPRLMFEEMERFLLPLSTVDAVADAKLLGLVTGLPVERLSYGLPAIKEFPSLTSTQWVNPGAKHDALKLHCFNASSLIETNDRWRDLPFANFHPNHAGDVLFFSLASQDVETPLFQKHVVCTCYADIVQAAGSKLETLKLRLPFVPRDLWVGEVKYFVHALERLGEDVTNENFIIFTRFLRRYRYSTFHLIDHARFSLGDSMGSAARTIQSLRPPVENRSKLPASPLKVLLHLSGGGWPLKAYPLDMAATLCTALKAMGCAVTVVDNPALAELTHVRSVVCDEVALLKEAISAHHLFIGIDSFPHHFARQVMGWPTIGLFGDTKPCNSDAAGGPSYRALAGDLPCISCGGQDKCPVFGRDDCSNYVPPAEVVTAVFEMAGAVYGAMV